MSLRCWWFGCECHSDEYAYTDNPSCMRCGGYVEYGDMAGDTRHNRFKEWANYWLFRKWWPAKCSCCHRRWNHDETVDHLPF